MALATVSPSAFASRPLAGVAAAPLAVDLGVGALDADALLVSALLAAAVLAGGYAAYYLTARLLLGRTRSRRRRQSLRSILRVGFVLATSVAAFGVLTRQWFGLLVSLGVVGFAVTFALQQPLFSLIGWVYIVVKRPFTVGDRIAIEGSKGDVVEVDLFTTTLWETNGELVSTNQPSGRTITVPNSVVLSSHVANYSPAEFPFVWNELPIQVAYETDLAFVREVMVEEADVLLGEEMAAHVATYRERLAETPVDLEVTDRPSVNVAQAETWVELRLRYAVHPRRGQRVRNALYERILARLNDHPDRVQFPVGRSR